MQNVYKPLVAHNYIEQNNSSSSFYSEGIRANNCDSTQVRCNGVRNLNVANTVTKGIVYSISSNASISCNSIDSTATQEYILVATAWAHNSKATPCAIIYWDFTLTMLD
jgi:hypothetical protein